MALVAYAPIIVTEFKRFFPAVGTGKDREIEEAIAQAAQDIEGEGLGGRRVVYRGPVESYTNVISGQAIANGAVTIAGAPNSAGRTLVVRKNDADRTVTGGVLTITQAAPALSETFNLADGDELHGTKSFTAAVTAAISGLAGTAVGDTIDVGTSEGYTEFYSPNGSAEVIPVEWPIQNVIALHEDQNRAFAAVTALVLGTDYEVRNPSTPRRRLVRLYGAREFPFYSGWRVVRGRMSSGYRTSAKVPPKIKGVCRELAAWYFQHAQGKLYGMATLTDAAGTRTFSGPPMLTDGMHQALEAYRRPEFGLTADRDFDLEASA